MANIYITGSPRCSNTASMRTSKGDDRADMAADGPAGPFLKALPIRTHPIPSTKLDIKPSMNIGLSKIKVPFDHNMIPIIISITLYPPKELKVILVGLNPIRSAVKCFVNNELEAIEIGTRNPVKIGIQSGITYMESASISIDLSIPINIVQIVMANRPIK